MAPVNEHDSGAVATTTATAATSTTTSSEDDFLASLDDHDAKDILDALNFMEEHGTDLTPNPVFSNGPPMAPPAPAHAPAPAPANGPPSAPGGAVVSMGPPRPTAAGKGDALSQQQKQQQQQQQQQKKPVHPFYFYRDFSNLQDPDPATPITAPGRIPNFPAKMYAILSRKDLTDIITWMPHGRSWRVLKPREFEVKVIPTYFEHSKFSSFIRQANGWGFRRIISKGPDRNSYYHELFLRGKPHLIKLMRRPPPSSKPLADANTEPDFYAISKTHPLPELKDDDGVKVAQNFPRQVAYSFVPPPAGAPAPGASSPAIAPTAAPVPSSAVSMTAPSPPLPPQQPHQQMQARAYYPTGAPPPPPGTAVAYMSHPAPPHGAAATAPAPGQHYAPTVYAQQQQHPPSGHVQHVVYAGAPVAPPPGAGAAAAAPAPVNHVNYDLGDDPLKDMFDKPFQKVDSSDNLLDLLAKPMPPPEYYGSHTFVPLLD